MRLCVYFGGLYKFKNLIESDINLQLSITRISGVWWEIEYGADVSKIERLLDNKGIKHAITT